MECEYCEKFFSSISSLNNHKKTAKYCLKLQNKKDDLNNFKCDDCSKVFYIKQHLSIHLQSCKETEIKNKLRLQEKEF